LSFQLIAKKKSHDVQNSHNDSLTLPPGIQRCGVSADGCQKAELVVISPMTLLWNIISYHRGMMAAAHPTSDRIAQAGAPLSPIITLSSPAPPVVPLSILVAKPFLTVC